MTTATAFTVVFHRTVRAAQQATVVAAVQTATTKAARKLPTITTTVTVSPAWDGHWCTAHAEPAHERQGCGYNPATPMSSVSPCHIVGSRLVEVHAEAVDLPVHDGWHVAAVLTRDPAGAITASEVGVFADRHGWARAHTAMAGQCVHCGLSRRRATTVLLHRDGDTIPVGRACLGEYTGGSITAAAVAALGRVRVQVQDDVDDAVAASGDMVPTVELVALAARTVTAYGFVSSADDGWVGIGTATRMRDELRNGGIVVTGAERAGAQRAIELVCDAALDEPGGPSGFLANLRAVVGQDWVVVSGRHQKVGLVAALPVAVDRIVADRRVREATPERVNAHFAELGDRVSVEGVVHTARVDNC